MASDFIGRREGDRIGLILFGERAYLQVPLTLDRETVKILLLEAFIGLAGEKTAIGDAITLAVKRIHDQGGIFGAAPGSVVLEHVHRDQVRLGWLSKRFWTRSFFSLTSSAFSGAIRSRCSRTVSPPANIVGGSGVPLGLPVVPEV